MAMPPFFDGNLSFWVRILFAEREMHPQSRKCTTEQEMHPQRGKRTTERETYPLELERYKPLKDL